MPFSFTPAMCADLSAMVTSDVNGFGGSVTRPFALVNCTSSFIKICGEFASAAAGSSLDAQFDDAVIEWYAAISGYTSPCPAYLGGYTMSVTVAGDGPDAFNPPASCVASQVSQSCSLPGPTDGPPCSCNTRQRATPFAMKPIYNVSRGRSSDTLMYCFDIITVTPDYPTGPCGKTTNLLKMEFWADDKQRRAVSSIGVLAATDSIMTWSAPVWGSSGDMVLKVTPLNWGLSQANGGKVCLDMFKTTNMDTFCLGSYPGNCWASFFDDSKNCCPLYLASAMP